MKIGDEIIDETKSASWKNIDMSFKSIHMITLFICSNKCSLSTPIIRDTSYTLPELTHSERKILFHFRRKAPPEKWKTLECTTDGSPDGEYFFSFFFQYGDLLEDGLRHFDDLSVNRVVSHIS